MKRFRAAPIVIVAAMLYSASTQAADGEWSRCQHAKYKAQQIGNMVLVVAYGAHPTAGYKTKLRRLPIEIYPPQFELLDLKPSGPAAQVITPFAEISQGRPCAAFPGR